MVGTGEEFLSSVNDTDKWFFDSFRVFLRCQPDTAEEFLTSVNDTGYACFSGVNNTAKFWFRSVNDTARSYQILKLPDTKVIRYQSYQKPKL